MARPHKGARVMITLRLPAATLARIEVAQEQLGIDRHSTILALIGAGLNQGKS